MQRLTNSLCTVVVTENTAAGAAEHGPYDRILNPRGYHPSEQYSTLVICVELPESTYTIALIGEPEAAAEDCAVLEGNQLVVLQGCDMTRLSLEDGKVLSYQHEFRFDIPRAIYPNGDGYLVVGELQVFWMNRHFQEQWRYEAQHVIVRWQMKEDCLLLWEEECIHGVGSKVSQVKLGFHGSLLPQ